MCAGDFQLYPGAIAAVRGDDDSNRTLCDELTGLAVPRGALSLQYASMRARALSAIGREISSKPTNSRSSESARDYSRHMSARQCSSVWTSLKPRCERVASKKPRRTLPP